MLYEDSLNMFVSMTRGLVRPNSLTYLGVLSACSGLNALREGCQVHGLVMKLGLHSDHYASIVDMLGRARLLREARDFIEGLPEQPGITVWQALLGACSIHGDYELGKYASNQLSLVAPETAAQYVLMANIYSSEGKWKERAGEIRKMKDMGVKKETGVTWIEIEMEVHSFVVADKMHRDSNTIYEVIAKLYSVMIDEGYTPDKRYILFPMKRDGDAMK
ncbi:unnamed protein product [Rhodiola kirilowii]